MVQWIRQILSRLTLKTFKQARRLVRVVVGFTLLLIGVALIVLPGPATVIIPLGLLVLAGEFVWARRLLKKFNEGVDSGFKGFRRFLKGLFSRFLRVF